VAAKVRHRSINNQKDYAQDCNQRKANRVLVMNDKSSTNPSSKKKALADDHVVVETKLMLPENRDKFEDASKKRRVESIDCEKEHDMVDNSVLNLDSELEQLKKENEILRLKQENHRMKEAMAGPSLVLDPSPLPPPRRHAQSYPPTHHHEFAPVENLFIVLLPEMMDVIIRILQAIAWIVIHLLHHVLTTTTVIAILRMVMAATMRNILMDIVMVLITAL